ncbi:DUF5615 family PIN-like protein [Synechococcus sp. C9]|uniref:DUF5615 family PIN-like protein n=1 Tax=Synechococcus sp. C9 TaxID=102119 RepID=UPI001FF23B78|nr:DUF5615 family PIN-like protein [Synechococcus sp. C9]
MKILVDMNLSPDWIQMFADQNIEALHWSSVGDPRASDSTILQWAKEQGYVVFTNDLDFGAILAATQANAPSVIQLRTQDLLPNKIGTVVIEALREFQDYLESGALMSIDYLNSRVRILPIQK